MGQSRITTMLAEPEAAMVDRLEALMKVIVGKVNAFGEPQDCGAELSEIEQITGISYSPKDFFELWSWTDERSLATVAAYGSPPPIADLTREELLDAVQACMSNEVDAETKYFMLGFLRRCLPEAFDPDLIYYPFRELTADEIVDEVLLRQRLFTEGGETAVKRHLLGIAEAVLADPDAKPWSIDWANGIRRRG